MPSVEVKDIFRLPRISRGAGIERKIKQITKGPNALEGEGFPVRRAFWGVSYEDLDPFVHMDQMGEINYAPGEPKGTPWHPHRGFETVTYMIDGTFEHADSTGGGGIITNGDTQWMTAGAGIVHIERPPEELVVSGGLFHGIQLWVNLPKNKKWVNPKYQHIGKEQLGLFTTYDAGALIRLIAGSIDNFRGPGTTFTDINMAHASLFTGAKLEINWPRTFNALLYVLTGSARVQNIGISSGQLIVFSQGDYIAVEGVRPDNPNGYIEILILGGQPIREKVVAYGPFVMNSKEEIKQAFEDYQKGYLGKIPG